MSFDLKLAAGVTIGLFMAFAITVFLDLLRARKTHKELTVEPYEHQVERGRVHAKYVIRAYPLTGPSTLRKMLDCPLSYGHGDGFNEGIRQILNEGVKR